MNNPLFPDLPRPWLFAHRGFSARKPENTLPAFEAAYECGVSGIELDVQLCATGELVVFHDWTVDRMTGSTGTVSQMSWRDLSKLSVAGEERIPLLTRVLDRLGRDMYYDIEIKTREREPTGIEQALGSMIESRGLADRVLVSSFNPIPLREFRRMYPRIPTSVIYSKDSEVPWILRGGFGRYIAGTDAIKPDHKLVGAFSMLRNRLTRTPVLPWTVDDPDEARRLIGLRCDGIITNEPALIAEAIREPKPALSGA